MSEQDKKDLGFRIESKRLSELDEKQREIAKEATKLAAGFFNAIPEDGTTISIIVNAAAMVVSRIIEDYNEKDDCMPREELAKFVMLSITENVKLALQGSEPKEKVVH